jgi:hypothetical protein
MSIISSDDLKLEANLGKQTDPAILEPHIESAEIELRKILGNEKYLLIEGYQLSTVESEKKILLEVKKGAVYLAMAYAVHSLNIETQGNGIVKIKGWDQSRSELLTGHEVKEMSDYFRSTAIIFLQPYIQSNSDSDNSGDSIDLGNSFMGVL